MRIACAIQGFELGTQLPIRLMHRRTKPLPTFLIKTAFDGVCGFFNPWRTPLVALVFFKLQFVVDEGFDTPGVIELPIAQWVLHVEPVTGPLCMLGIEEHTRIAQELCDGFVVFFCKVTSALWIKNKPSIQRKWLRHVPVAFHWLEQ